MVYNGNKQGWINFVVQDAQEYKNFVLRYS